MKLTRKWWWQIMKSVISACLYPSEKVKWFKIKGNIGANDSHPMHRSANYGHVGVGYHHIYFQIWDLSIKLWSMYGEKQIFT